jgi:hypothetical protein
MAPANWFTWSRFTSSHVSAAAREDALRFFRQLAPPVLQQHEATDRTAEMREMRDPGFVATDAEKQFQQDVADHEHPGRHRDRQEDQEHLQARIHHAERDQQAEDRAGRAKRRIKAVGEVLRDQHVRNRRGHRAEEVIERVMLRAQQMFDGTTEHPQREHVEEDVRPAAVQERVRDHLPDIKSRRHHLAVRILHQLRVADRPQRTVGKQQGLQRRNLFQQEDHHVGDQQCARDGRQVVEHGRPVGDGRTRVPAQAAGVRSVRGRRQNRFRKTDCRFVSA